MTDRWQRWLVSVVVAVLLVPWSVGCAKRPGTTAASAPAPTATSTSTPTPATASQTPRALVPASSAGAAAQTATAVRPVPGDFVPNAALQDIHFAFDRYEITATDAAVLNGHTTWLTANAGYLLLIEGHADERGTSEYNLALGDRRAKATTNYLVSRGIPARRITTISYGEDRPVCRDHAEACWARNRRAHFLVKAQ